ncbi:hypothetical protein [Streptomyces uncialis]|uniref:hypothetical protein n=1 Tax=Streptomyces uncialis TaxID=1048205 RepID=UPI00386D8938|nr:hypothetical protein OG924_25130 [Streptomyces uncialis]
MSGFRTDSTRTARARFVAWTVAGVLAGSLAAAGCGDQDNGGRGTRGADREAEQPSGSTWAAGITPEWMSKQMGLTVPTAAKSAEAAYEITSRFDTGLLTFTLTSSEAERYLKENPPKGKWLRPTAAATDAEPHDFAHFGLPEPETVKDGVRYGYVCPGADAPQATGTPSGASEDPFGSSDAYDMSDERCVRLYAHEYSPDRTRVYLRAHYDPGLSDLPASSSPLN